MKEYITKLCKHPFVTDTMFFLCTSGLVNVLNYVFLLVAGRYLIKVDFGTFNSLVACITISGIVANAFQFQITKIIAEQPPSEFCSYWQKIIRNTVYRSLVFFVIALLLTPLLSPVLKATYIEIIWMFFTVWSVVCAAVANGVSGGLKKIKRQAIWNLVGTVLKFVCGIFLFVYGYKIVGGLFAYSIGFVLVVYFTYNYVRKNMASLFDAENNVQQGIAHQSSLLFVLCFLLIVVPFVLDQILVQVINQPLSGDYGALTTLGKLVFFAGFPISLVLFPYLAACKGDYYRQRRYFIVGLLIALAISGFIVVCLVFFTETIIKYTFSENYLLIAPSLPKFACALLLYMTSYISVQFLLVRDEYYVLVPLLIAVVVQVLLFTFFHSSLEQAAQNQVITYITQASLLGAYVFIRWGKIGSETTRK